MNYALYALNGNCVQQNVADFSDTYCFDFTMVSSGMYLLRVNLADSSYTFKLVIR